MFHVKHAIHGPSDFQRDTGVSRETLSRLETYADLLTKWNKTTNLIAPSTVPQLWQRHMLDSAQLWPFIQDAQGLIDLGSGAGFPGVVLAIMGLSRVHLVESDQRKAAFLREALRVGGTTATVHAHRFEALGPIPFTHITARAVASVPELLEVTAAMASPETTFVLLKGQKIEDELTAAHKMWKMRVEIYPSRTDPTGRIVILREVSRVVSGNNAGGNSGPSSGTNPGTNT